MRKTLLTCISMLLFAVVGAQGQDAADSTKSQDLSAVQSLDTSKSSAGLDAPAMSPATKQGDIQTTGSELVTQAGNTMMTPGLCLVIDALVMEFCNANPDDISCQFR